MVSYSDTPMHLCSASGGFWCPPKSLPKSGEKFGKMAQLSGFLCTKVCFCGRMNVGTKVPKCRLKKRRLSF